MRTARSLRPAQRRGRHAYRSASGRNHGIWSLRWWLSNLNEGIWNSAKQKTPATVQGWSGRPVAHGTIMPCSCCGCQTSVLNTLHVKYAARQFKRERVVAQRCDMGILSSAMDKTVPPSFTCHLRSALLCGRPLWRICPVWHDPAGAGAGSAAPRCPLGTKSPEGRGLCGERGRTRHRAALRCECSGGGYGAPWRGG